jgi:hypothetical protein
MNPIRIRTTLTSDTLHLPALGPLVGRAVEITVSKDVSADDVRVEFCAELERIPETDEALAARSEYSVAGGPIPDPLSTGHRGTTFSRVTSIITASGPRSKPSPRKAGTSVESTKMRFALKMSATSVTRTTTTNDPPRHERCTRQFEEERPETAGPVPGLKGPERA